MISVSVVGASGYAGGELIRLLANHPEAKLVGAYDIRNAGQPVSNVHPHLRGIADLVIVEPDYDKIGKISDVIFAATPHGVAMKFVPKLLEGKTKVVDLGADYRFDDPKVFEQYYIKHESPNVKGVYGLPEFYREQIKRARLVANPGCYPTAAILSLAPLLKAGLIDTEHIIIDAKSGTSGVGAGPSEVTHHPVCGANMRAYAATTHRHAPEIAQELSKLAGRPVKLGFTPHLIPIVRGILSTAHVFMKKTMGKEALLGIYRDFYRNERFVRVREDLPQVNFVVGSNYCDIGLEPDTKSNRLVVVSVIDNLIKGASGQAIQNMNLMFNFDEAEGLAASALRP